MKIDDNEDLIVESSDVFDLNYNLGQIIYSFLVKFKEEYLADEHKATPCEDMSIDAWLVIIDKMIYAFDANIAEDVDTRDRPYEYVKETKEINNEVHTYFDYMLKNGFTLKDAVNYTKEGYTLALAIRDKKDEGRQLFAKYFEKLWV